MLLLAAPLSVCAYTIKKPKTLNYLGLGDSLAAGKTPYKTLGNGYTDFLAYKLTATGCMGTFQKRYAVSGHKTNDVLNDIRNDVKKDLPEDTDTVGIRACIASADIITINAGANDLLQSVTIGPTGTVTFDPAVIADTLSQVSINFGAIISEIKAINPSCKIYIMGYYNAFPHFPQASQQLLIPSMVALNNVLEQVALQTETTYVPTFDAIAQNAILYLPNPEDIHPNEDGYRLMADLLWEKIQLNLTTFYFEAPTEVLTEGSNAKLSLTGFSVISKHYTVSSGIFSSVHSYIGAFKQFIQPYTDYFLSTDNTKARSNK